MNRAGNAFVTLQVGLATACILLCSSNPASGQLDSGALSSSELADAGASEISGPVPEKKPAKYSAGATQRYGASYAYDSEAFSDEPPTERYRQQEYRWAPAYDSTGDYRQPVAMLPLDDESFLIATQKSGQLLVFDLPSRKTTTVDLPPGEGSFLHLERLSETVFAVAEETQERVWILRLEKTGTAYRAVSICYLAVPGGCGHMQYDAATKTLYASGRWSRRLFAWTFDLHFAVAQHAHTDLTVNGGQILLFGEGKHRGALVADAFGDRIELIGCEPLRSKKVHRLYDHNFQAMRFSADSKDVLLACQNLSDFIPAVRGEITWGGMLSNNVRRIPLVNLLTEEGDSIYRKAEFFAVGFAGNGGGTPADIAQAGDGTLAVAMSGSSQLAVRVPGEQDFRFFETGLMPIDVEIDSGRTQAIVLCKHSDSITLVPLSGSGVAEHVMLGPLRKPTLTELGEQRFHDSRISHDGWLSCASCHVGGHTSGLLNDNLTDHSQGTAKRILSLLGSRETAPYSWFGEQEELEDQVAHSIESTMASDHSVAARDVEAISAFIRTLPPPPSVSAARGENVDSLRSGRRIFLREGCVDCHAGVSLTSAQAYDVGLVDEQGARRFNPPSLRGVSQRENALLHDGRAKDLEDLLLNHQHQLEDPLPADELKELLRYLRSL